MSRTKTGPEKVPTVKESLERRCNLLGIALQKLVDKNLGTENSIDEGTIELQIRTLLDYIESTPEDERQSVTKIKYYCQRPVLKTDDSEDDGIAEEYDPVDKALTLYRNSVPEFMLTAAWPVKLGVSTQPRSQQKKAK